ncbi:TPA: hypothetical protein ACH3X1_013612 [Trebouxia sp. C0004]
MEICCTYRCAVTQHKCSAALFKAECNPHCSVLLCKPGSQQEVCHCSYTFGDLLFIRCALTQHKCSAERFRAKCSPHCSVLVYKTGSQQEVCHCSYTFGDLLCMRCAVTQHKCIAARFRAKCSPHCSVLVYKTGSQQAVFHCSYTYGDLLFRQVCSDPTPMHCSSLQGNMQSPLFSAALQTRFTAGSLSLQLHLWRSALCTDVQCPAPTHCSSVQGKMQSPLFSAGQQIRLTAGSVSLQLHLRPAGDRDVDGACDCCRRLLLQQHPAVQDKAVATSCPDKTKLLPPAVQASSAGRQQAAALREVLRQEAWAEVTSCVADEKSTSDERAGWVAAARSLIEGCFIEQDTATLLCGYSVTIYVIAHADVDHLQVTKYADPKEPAADFLWLYVTGNRYQLVGPMQQFVVMKAATSTGEDKDFVLAPHGYAVPHGGVAQQAVVHAPGVNQMAASAAAREASLAPMTCQCGR